MKWCVGTVLGCPSGAVAGSRFGQPPVVSEKMWMGTKRACHARRPSSCTFQVVRHFHCWII